MDFFQWSLKQHVRLVFTLCAFGIVASTSAQLRSIKNDTFWQTVDGKPLYSQGGGIFQFKNPTSGKLSYYWYGVHYKEADKYKTDPSVTLPKSTFQAVTCYSSDNLVDWHFEGDVLDQEALSRERPTWVGRLGVAYIKELKLYAMFVQHGRHVLITTSASPTGPFSWYRQLDMTAMIGTSNTGDQTVFTDPDTGKSYLIYSYGRGRSKIYVSEIGVKNGQIGLLDCSEIYHGAGREGNCLFKYKGKYYMCASNLYGWDGSYPYYLVSDDIRGPYTPINNMLVMNGAAEDYAHISQTGFFVTVKGSLNESVIYCGDRWSDFAGNGLGYNVWCPLSFKDDQPWFNSVSSWKMDVHTGNWAVGIDNNYVKNGSFEADRRHIPSPVKPVQAQLSGWVSEVIKGNPIRVGEPNSPVLNYFNTSQDRKFVTGEKSLAITDNRDFIRRVYQKIASTDQVPLPDGYYVMSLKIKAGSRSKFNSLKMYAISGGTISRETLIKLKGDWEEVQLRHIPIKNGQVEIGVEADGTAGAFCYIDDITLVRQ